MPTETENSRKGKDLHAAKLLLVEDDPALSELLEYRFSNEGYQVRTTSDGDEALLLACEDVPDLVILDWMIEGTSGIEVCRRLRRDKATLSRSSRWLRLEQISLLVTAMAQPRRTRQRSGGMM